MTAPAPQVICAFDFAPDGAAAAIPGPQAPPAGAGWRWIHLDRAAPGAAAWLRDPQGAGLPPLAAEALLAEDTRPRAIGIGEGALVILRGVNLNPDSAPEDMVSIRLWIAPGRVVSVVIRRLAAVAEIREAAEAGQGPATPGRFLAMLADGLTARMGPVLDALDDRFGALEDLFEEGEGGERLPPTRSAAQARAALADLRRTAIPLRRYFAPQRDALEALRRLSAAGLSGPEAEALAEAQDRLTRYVEDLDALRERASALSEQIEGRAAERMNRAMYALSIVTALFLPLGFLTGLLGVNLAGLPGAAYPWAFGLFCAALVVVFALEFWLIRRLRLL